MRRVRIVSRSTAPADLPLHARVERPDASERRAVAVRIVAGGDANPRDEGSR
jgi:hypothetical protein